MLLDINLQPQRSSSNKLNLEWIQEYIKCKIKLSLILVLHLNAVQVGNEYVHGSWASGVNAIYYQYTLTSAENGLITPNNDANLSGNIRSRLATINDLRGNLLSLPDTLNIPEMKFTTDNIKPSVTKLTLLAPDLSGGYLPSGKELFVGVEFSENVRVTGTPQITVEIGSSSPKLDYLIGSGSSYLLFKTTIAQGASDHDGVMVPADSLALNGGAINDFAGNAAVLSHAYVPVDPTIRIGANPFSV